jgi:Vps51/Vps67
VVEALPLHIMQVYENYNRFITATDTIRELKTNIDAASPSMTQLQDTSGAQT